MSSTGVQLPLRILFVCDRWGESSPPGTVGRRCRAWLQSRPSLGHTGIAVRRGGSTSSSTPDRTPSRTPEPTPELPGATLARTGDLRQRTHGPKVRRGDSSHAHPRSMVHCHHCPSPTAPHTPGRRGPAAAEQPPRPGAGPRSRRPRPAAGATMLSASFAARCVLLLYRRLDRDERPRRRERFATRAVTARSWRLAATLVRRRSRFAAAKASTSWLVWSQTSSAVRDMPATRNTVSSPTSAPALSTQARSGERSPASGS
jgi:hypothetical protein